MHDHAEQVDAVALALIAPPAQEVRTPLDEWDILQRAAGHSHPGTAGYDIELARFVESAHGITAAQEGASDMTDNELLDQSRPTLEALRSAGFAVTVFTPEELEDANPETVEDSMVERGWFTIEQENED